MHNLHTIKKPKIFPISLLNVYSIVTSIFDPVLGLEAITASPPPILA